MAVARVRGLEPTHDIKRGVWYRVGWYDKASKSHRVHDVEQDVFYCGRLVWPDPDLLDAVVGDEWIVYPEERKNPSRCSACVTWAKHYDASAMFRLRAREKAEGQHLYDRLVTFDDLMRMARQLDMERAYGEE
jgi:hypothetical protein